MTSYIARPRNSRDFSRALQNNRIVRRYFLKMRDENLAF